MIVFPCSKINLGLNIVSRRSDGYHNIETVMMPIPWTDILEIVPAKGTTTTLTVSGRGVDCPPENNLVMKAYRALNKAIELPPVDIYLQKIIPDGAGLGGGSADAAFTLTALNSMLNLDLPVEQLAEIAATIGADSPLFVYNHPMSATGIGTELTPCELPELRGKALVVVKPQGSVSTAEAYARVEPKLPQMLPQVATAQPLAEWRRLLVNDFEESVSRRLPVVGEIKRRLYDAGAVYASMSGSGSAVYGIFDADKMAEQATGLMTGHTVFSCKL